MIPYPIAFFWIIFGVISISRLIILVSQWKQSQKWRSICGSIIQSEIESVLVPRGGKKGYFNGIPNLIVAYIPKILYEYRVNAETFQSKQIFLGQQFPTNFNTADDLVERYPVGKEVTVYFDPEKPGFAVLERDAPKAIELLGELIFCMLFLLFGLGMLAQSVSESAF